MKRPRGGEVWRRKEDGKEVLVVFRRLINPLGGVRSGLRRDVWWSLISCEPWPEGSEHWSPFGIHESDFVRDYEFVRKR